MSSREKAFSEAGERCAIEIAKAREFWNRVKKMEQTVEEMRGKLQAREKDAEDLRGMISEIIARGENADEQILKRSTLLAESQVLRDLIEDMLKKKIPAAREAAKQAERGPRGILLTEMNTIRDKFQQEEINTAAKEVKELVETLRECMNVFIGSYPDINLWEQSKITWPHIPNPTQLQGRGYK